MGTFGIGTMMLSETMCLFKTELISGSFGNIPVKKNRNYVIGILSDLYRKDYSTN